MQQQTFNEDIDTHIQRIYKDLGQRTQEQEHEQTKPCKRTNAYGHVKSK